MDPNRLVPGTVARRYSEPAPRPARRRDVLLRPHARLRGNATHDQHLVVCTSCGPTYDVEFIDKLGLRDRPQIACHPEPEADRMGRDRLIEVGRPLTAQ